MISGFVATNFPGNKKFKPYKDFLENLQLSYQTLGCNMSWKMHFRRSNMDFFSKNFGAMSSDHRDCLIVISLQWRGNNRKSGKWKLTGFQLAKKFPAFFGTRMFITAFTNARHLSLSWARSFKSMSPYPTSRLSILIISSHLRPSHSSCLLPSGTPTTTLYTTLLFPIRTTSPAHPTILDFITRTVLGVQYRSLSFSLCSFLLSPVTSSLFDTYILLNTLFSNTLSLRFSPSKSDQVSQPYKTRGKIIILYILILKFLNSKQEEKRFCTDWQQAHRDLNLFLISSWIEF